MSFGPKTRSRDRDEAKTRQGETLRRYKQTVIPFFPQRCVVSLGFFDKVSVSGGQIKSTAQIYHRTHLTVGGTEMPLGVHRPPDACALRTHSSTTLRLAI